MPFQVGTALNEKLASVQPGARWTPFQGDDLASIRVGERVKGWDGGNFNYLYLNEQGFGVLISRQRADEEALLEPVCVAEWLEARRVLHRESINGTNGMGALIRDISTTTRDSVGLRESRPDIFSGIPYVFSYFVVDGDLVEITHDPTAVASLLALLEPSLVEGDDDVHYSFLHPTQEVARAIRALDSTAHGDLLRDFDISEEKAVLMSWAGIVAIMRLSTVEAEGTLRLYRELEARTQLNWSMAYYGRLWCNAALGQPRIPDSVAEAVRYGVSPILREAVRLNDASMPTRIRQLLRGLDETSDLPAEVAAAEEALVGLERYLLFKHEYKGRRVSRLLETALFLLTLTQAVPLFFSTPLWAAPREWFTVAGACALIGGLLIVIFRK